MVFGILVFGNYIVSTMKGEIRVVSPGGNASRTESRHPFFFLFPACEYSCFQIHPPSSEYGFFLRAHDVMRACVHGGQQYLR